MIDADLLVPFILDHPEASLYSYQKFIERTRYLRRGDYVFANVPVIPLVYAPSGDHYPTLHFRLTSSFLRHNTILIRPILSPSLDTMFTTLIHSLGTYPVEDLIKGRLNTSLYGKYRPVGYYISSEKDKIDLLTGKRHLTVKARGSRLAAKLQ